MRDAFPANQCSFEYVVVGNTSLGRTTFGLRSGETPEGLSATAGYTDALGKHAKTPGLPDSGLSATMEPSSYFDDYMELKITFQCPR